MNAVYLVIGLLLGIVLVAFGAQNAQAVSLHFFTWNSTPIPLVLALGVAMLLGMLVTLLLSIPGRVRARRQRQDLLRQLDAQARLGSPAAVPSVSERGDSVS